jgi:hypothetical protein
MPSSTFNYLIYYSSIITSRGLHVSCYTAPRFIFMCNIIFIRA